MPPIGSRPKPAPPLPSSTLYPAERRRKPWWESRRLDDLPTKVRKLERRVAELEAAIKP